MDDTSLISIRLFIQAEQLNTQPAADHKAKPKAVWKDAIKDFFLYLQHAFATKTISKTVPKHTTLTNDDCGLKKNNKNTG